MSDEANIEKEIENLQRQYAKDLSAKVEELRRLAAQCEDGNTQGRKSLAKACHRIAGSGGTYKFNALSRMTRWLEEEILQGRLDELPPKAAARRVSTWLVLFSEACAKFAKLSTLSLAGGQPWTEALARVDLALTATWERQQARLEGRPLEEVA